MTIECKQIITTHSISKSISIETHKYIIHYTMLSSVKGVQDVMNLRIATFSYIPEKTNPSCDQVCILCAIGAEKPIICVLCPNVKMCLRDH